MPKVKQLTAISDSTAQEDNVDNDFIENIKYYIKEHDERIFEEQNKRRITDKKELKECDEFFKKIGKITDSGFLFFASQFFSRLKDGFKITMPRQELEFINKILEKNNCKTPKCLLRNIN